MKLFFLSIVSLVVIEIGSASLPTSWTGLKVQRENSAVILGEKGDVAVKRSGANSLLIEAETTTFTGNIAFDSQQNVTISAAAWMEVQQRLENISKVLRDNGMDPSGNMIWKDCKQILKKKPTASSGVYTINYKGKNIQVLCDMKTAGGGWTLILRDSWKDKTVYAHGQGLALPKENSVGAPGDTKDYVGPHYMGSVAGTSPLKTNAQYMYKIDSCSTGDCALISDQEYSFHATKETDVDKGYHSSPIRTLSGKTVHADNSNNNRLNYFYLYPSPSCGLSTDRDNGGNCWNNMFGTHRWENLPGGKTQCFLHSNCKTSGDANTLWVRERDPIDPSLQSCSDIKKKHPSSTDGFYTITYDGKELRVKCDMTTQGGGWTLILRDSWNDKSVFWDGTTAMRAENSHGTPEGYKDYVGPHYMGSKKGTSPLLTNADYMYTGSGCSSADCKFISTQQYSFHENKESVVDAGFHSTPLKTLSGKVVRADQNNNNRLNYFYLYPSGSCGISTDRDNGGNCWNNMFAKSRWENMPGGGASCHYHSTTSCHSNFGDANHLWARARN